MKNTIFVDTSAWIALMNKDDELHLESLVLHQELMTQNHLLITTDYVLTELANGMSKVNIWKPENLLTFNPSNRLQILRVKTADINKILPQIHRLNL